MRASRTEEDKPALMMMVAVRIIIGCGLIFARQEVYEKGKAGKWGWLIGAEKMGGFMETASGWPGACIGLALWAANKSFEVLN